MALSSAARDLWLQPPGLCATRVDTYRVEHGENSLRIVGQSGVAFDARCGHAGVGLTPRFGKTDASDRLDPPLRRHHVESYDTAEGTTERSGHVGERTAPHRLPRAPQHGVRPPAAMRPVGRQAPGALNPHRITDLATNVVDTVRPTTSA